MNPVWSKRRIRVTSSLERRTHAKNRKAPFREERRRESSLGLEKKILPYGADFLTHLLFGRLEWMAEIVTKIGKETRTNLLPFFFILPLKTFRFANGRVKKFFPWPKMHFSVILGGRRQHRKMKIALSFSLKTEFLSLLLISFHTSLAFKIFHSFSLAIASKKVWEWRHFRKRSLKGKK